MKSTEKVYEALEALQAQDDDELTEALPFRAPPALVRGALVAVASNLPQDPADLDEFLTNVAGFCMGMRSDPQDAEVVA